MYIYMYIYIYIYNLQILSCAKYTDVLHIKVYVSSIELTYSHESSPLSLTSDVIWTQRSKRQRLGPGNMIETLEHIEWSLL